MPVTVGGSTITMNSGAVIQNPPGNTSCYMARAWVNFNGTGTVSIRASGNVSSITDNGTGDYTVNFSGAMTDTNYSGSFGQVTTFGSQPAVNVNGMDNAGYQTTTSYRLFAFSVGSGLTDKQTMFAQFYR